MSRAQVVGKVGFQLPLDPNSFSPRGPQVACVTGASRGIGLGIALRLARDGCEFFKLLSRSRSLYTVAVDVTINDIAANQAGIDLAVNAIESLGRKAVGVVADVTDEEQVEQMVAKTVEALGSLDVMVANAGVCQVKPLLETTAADRQFIMDVNVHGLMNTFVSAARQMVKQGKGGWIIGACVHHFPCDFARTLTM